MVVRPYLRGPIPWDWLFAAMKLPAGALKVGLALWHYHALNRTKPFKKGTGDIARLLGISTDTARRGIDALAGLDLIQVECAPGRKCVFTMPAMSLLAQGGNPRDEAFVGKGPPEQGVPASPTNTDERIGS